MITERCYKLTRRDRTTHNGYQWGPLRWHETTGDGELCGPGWLHAYTDPVLAVMLNPIHADIALNDCVLWEAQGAGQRKDDHGLKVGYTRMRLIRRIPLPKVSIAARVRFGILCARQIYHDPAWRAWADAWLSGADRSEESAWAASARAGVWVAAEESAARAARAAACRGTGRSTPAKKMWSQLTGAVDRYTVSVGGQT